MTLRERVLILVSVAMMLFGGLYHWWYQPANQRMLDLDEQIKLYETKLKTAEVNILDTGQIVEPDWESQMLQFREKQTQQEKQVPYQRAIPGLIDQLCIWAEQTGITLTGLGMEQESSDSGFGVICFRTQINGEQDQVIEYLSKLEQSERLVSIEEVNLNYDQKIISNPVLQAQIRFSTYFDARDNGDDG